MTPDALATLHAAAFPGTRGWSPQEFEPLLAHSGTTLCATEHAFALIRVTLDEAELLTIATHPHYQRQGLAKQLLDEAEAAAIAQGAQAIFLEVAENNSAARALYDAKGYRKIGYRPGYYRQTDNNHIAALVLRKQLLVESLRQ